MPESPVLTDVEIEQLTRFDEHWRVILAAYDVAGENGQSASMVQAAMGIATLQGMLVDKVEQTTGAIDAMKPDELTAGLAKVQAELDAIENPSAAEHEGYTQY